MRSVALRWLFPVLRYGLCAAAIVFLVLTVPWHDHVRLDDQARTRVRLIQNNPESRTLVIELHGQRVTRPYSDFVPANTKVAGSAPHIELGIAGVIKDVDRGEALLALAIFAPVWIIQSFRLVVMLGIQGVRLAQWSAIKLTLAGNFFNFALPGSTGGDLIKAYYLSHYTHLKTEAVTTVFLDRVIGLLGVVLMATGAILSTHATETFHMFLGGLALIFGCLAIGAALVLSPRLRSVLRLRQLALRLPMSGQLIRVGRAILATRHHKGRILVALLVTLTLQAIVLVSATIMGWALGMGGSMREYFAYVSIGFMIASIPIFGFQAIGVLEAAYVQFFTSAGIGTASQAVALAVALRLIQLAWSLPGVLVPLLGAHLPRRTELAALEAAAEEVPQAAERPADHQAQAHSPSTAVTSSGSRA